MPNSIASLTAFKEVAQVEAPGELIGEVKLESPPVEIFRRSFLKASGKKRIEYHL